MKNICHWIPVGTFGMNQSDSLCNNIQLESQKVSAEEFCPFVKSTGGKTCEWLKKMKQLTCELVTQVCLTKFWTGRKFWILKHLNNIIMHGVVY